MVRFVFVTDSWPILGLPIQTQKSSTTWFYYSAYIAMGLTMASMGPTLSGLAKHTQSTLSQISWLFTARGFGYLAGSLVSGRWYDRVPGHPLMVGAMIAMVATMGLTPVVPVLWLLVAVMFLLGTAEGALDVGGNTLLIWIYGIQVAPFMSALHFFFGVGAFLGPLIVSRLVSLSGDILWPYWVLALLIAPVALGLSRLPSPAPQREADDGGEKPVDNRLVILMVLFFFLYVGAEVGYGGWIYTYTTASHLGDGMMAGYLNSAFWGAFTLGRLLSIPLSARLKPQTILLGGLFGCLASVGVVLTNPGSVGGIWTGSLGAGFFMAPLFPVAMNLAGSRMAMTGRITGWFFVGSGAGGMFFPWLIGQWFEGIGPWITMAVIAADVVVTAGVVMLFSAWSEEPALEELA